MTLNDLYATQNEAHFYTLLMLGVCTTCLCLTRYISAKIIAEAISKQKVVIREAVWDPNAVYNHWLSRPIIAETTFAQTQ